MSRWMLGLFMTEYFVMTIVCYIEMKPGMTLYFFGAFILTLGIYIMTP